MKRLIMLLGTFAMIAVSCQKEPQEGDGTDTGIPVVSISADRTFNSDNIAQLVLSLSTVSGKDVTVKLKDAAPEEGKSRVPANYQKTATVKAGETSAQIEVEADVLGLESGSYQAAIEMVSAEGAELAETKTVHIALDYAFRPKVNVYADNVFAGDRTATVKIVLTAAAPADVTVNLGTLPESKATVNYDRTVTVPAGETEAQVTVTVDIPDGLEPGVYPAIIGISSVENADKGDVTSVSIDLRYPFSANIVIDGDFGDWNDPNVFEWTLPEGQVLYGMIKSLRLAANGKRVFLYFEFDDPVNNYGAHLAQPVTPFADNSLPLNIYLDSDGNPATGAVVTAVDNDTFFPPYEATSMGIEYYIELALHDVAGAKFNDFYSYGGVYRYGGADGDGVFSGLTNLGGTYDGSAIFGEGTYEDGTGRVEVQLSREFFGITGNKVRLAVKIMDMGNNWGCIGLLPQGNMTSLADKTREHVDMATITIPDYVQ
ncbi:MAG: hypothetical protein NC115_00445 [Bacteroidales bacterium]|nr:hypothetical protein [Bacteroidales bacterium]